jgi:hypothetical protein
VPLGLWSSSLALQTGAPSAAEAAAAPTGKDWSLSNFIDRRGDSLFVYFGAYRNDSLDWLDKTMTQRTKNDKQFFFAIHPPVVPYADRGRRKDAPGRSGLDRNPAETLGLVSMRYVMTILQKTLLPLSVLLTLASAGSAKQPATTPFARAPYLQQATSDSIFVVWRTRAPITAEVRYGFSPGRLDGRVRGTAIVTRAAAATSTLPRLHSAPEGTHQYEARITGLKPDTRYYYAVYDGGKRLTGTDGGSYQFRTNPVVGANRRMRFWVVGDSGTGGKAQAEVYAAMRAYNEQQKLPLDFYLHVGDMAYKDGKDTEFQTGFFQVYEPTLRNVVCWPAMGNHEGHTSSGVSGIGPYYDAYVVPTRAEAGGVASGTEAYYSFDYGRAHFICLNSHDLDRTPTGAMAQWLKADLEKVKADWLIAFFHHPPYTKGSHDSDLEKQLIEMRTHIMPILESAGVDVVLTGHSHIYERSMLTDGAYATPTVAENVILDDGDGDPKGDGAYKKSAGLHPNQGAVQVVTGNGGAGTSRKGTMPIMKRVSLENGSVLVNIQGDTLTAIHLTRTGEKQDLFSIVKRGQVTPNRLSNPRQLPPYAPPANTAKDAD